MCNRSKCILLLVVLSFVESVFSHYEISGPPCSFPRINNGRVRARRRGNLLNFSCSDQYTLVGNKYATCRSGQWNVPIPVCVKTGCQQLEEVKNAVNLTYYDNAWVEFACLFGFQLVGSEVLYCDGTQWNSTTPKCYESSAKNTEIECNFEQSNICGWKQDVNHDFDWTRLNKKTPSSFLQTGPQYDHTYGKNGSGYYMYIESTGKNKNNTARLMSPVYEADLAKGGCFVFWYHMYGRSMGGLVAYQKPAKLSMIQLQELLLQKNAQNYTLFKQWGDQDNEWHKAIAMLSDFGDNFQIVIEGIRGVSFMSDIAIDDVSIQHGENCTKATTPPSVLRSTTEDYSSSDTSVIPPQTKELVAATAESFAPTPSSTTTASTMTTTKRPTIPVSREPTTTTTTATTNNMPAINTIDTKKPATTTSAIEKPANTTTATEKPATTTTATEKPATTTTELPATTTTATKMPATNKSPTRYSTSTTNTTTAPRPTSPRKTIPTNATSKIVTIEVSFMTSSTISVVRTTIDNAGVKNADVCTCDCRGSGKG